MSPYIMPRVRIYLLLVMTLIVVTGFAGVTLITHNADRQALASAFDQKVATASASLLKKTMALLPDGKVKENQAELFRLALIRVPEITYLAILDGRRKILVEAGNRPAGLADVDPSGARQLAEFAQQGEEEKGIVDQLLGDDKLMVEVMELVREI